MTNRHDFDLTNIEELLASEGKIEVGYQHPIGEIATAIDGHHQALAMLRRGFTETFADTLLRLDAAIGEAMRDGTCRDEINR